MSRRLLFYCFSFAQLSLATISANAESRHEVLSSENRQLQEFVDARNYITEIFQGIKDMNLKQKIYGDLEQTIELASRVENILADIRFQRSMSRQNPNSLEFTNAISGLKADMKKRLARVKTLTANAPEP